MVARPVKLFTQSPVDKTCDNERTQAKVHCLILRCNDNFINFPSALSVKELMKFLWLVIFISTFAFAHDMARAEVNFVTYLKRNHQTLNKNKKVIEKVAFQEKQRSIASIEPTPETKSENKTNPKPITAPVESSSSENASESGSNP